MQPGTVERLDRYVRDVFTCPVERARAGGVHLVAEPRRALPGWLGYVYALVGVAFEGPGAAIAARPELAAQLAEAMGSDLRLARLDPAAMRRLLRHARRLVPHAFTLGGDIRVVDGESFKEHRGAWPVEEIPTGDPAASDLRRRFDGAVFAVRAPRGTLASWAALKLKSDDVWEVAVTTQPDYRGRGMARSVVSAATRYCLDHGKLCLYVHDHENRTSAFVSRALGYARYAEVVIAEF